MKVDQKTEKLIIYEFEGCPFCIRVRRVLRALNLKIETRDVRKVDKYRDELMKGGGEFQVPCMRIQKDDGTIQWMYESAAIILYLRERFSE